MKKIMSSLIVLVMLVGIATPSFAAENDKNKISETTLNKESIVQDLNGYNFSEEELAEIEALLNDEEMQQQIEDGIALQPYVNVDGDLIEFDHKQALVDGLHPKLVHQAKKDYDKANKEFQKNKEVRSNKNNNSRSVLNNETTFSTASVNATSNCGGRTYVDGNIVGGTIYLDSCRTNKMIGLIAIGAGASSLIALIPVAGTIVATVAVALYTIGGGVLAYNNADGNGVKIKVLRNPFTKKLYPYWVRPQ